MLWFLIKVFILLFCYIWLRGTLPRVRYDQLMAIGWKVLIPVSIVWILLIATVRAWRLDSHTTAPYVVFGFVIVLIMLLVMDVGQRRAAAGRQVSRPPRPPCQRGRARRALIGQPGIRFPVPPLDLPHYHGIGWMPTGLAPSDIRIPPPKEVTGA